MRTLIITIVSCAEFAQTEDVQIAAKCSAKKVISFFHLRK